MLGGENIQPQPDIGDGFFDFNLIQSNQFNFENVFTANIVVDSDKYTYWKIERYENNQLERTFYFYTNRVLGMLKNAFILELSLDTYLTYTRNVIKSINFSPWINRGTIISTMLEDSTYRQAYLKSLKEPEQDVLGGNDSYTNSEIFNLISEGRQNAVSDSYYPFRVKNLIYKNTKNVPLLVRRFYSADGINQGFGSSTQTTLWGNVVKKNGTTLQDYGFTDRYARDGRSWTLASTTYPDRVQKLNDLIKSSMSIEAINKSDNPNNWDEINRNMMNSYFAVFFHPDGWIDAYPLLGVVNARISTVYMNRVRDNQTLPTTGGGTLYWNLDQRATMLTTLYNDFESIRKDYIDFNSNNEHGGYTTDSFQGIYRWIYPLGEKSHIQFSLSTATKDLNVDGGQVSNGAYNVSQYARLQRFFYRFNYNDALKFNLIDGARVKKFKLCNLDNLNFVDDYIKLLQPIVISGNEFIPAKYTFLAQKENRDYTFSIPLTTAFTGGFKLYCTTHLYNNPTLITDLGGTLPTVNGKYFQTLREIERQKNAGVASAVGNLFARPLNWLSGGFSKGFTGQLSNIASDTTAFNRTTKYNKDGAVSKRQPQPTKSETINNGWNRTDTNTGQRQWGATVSGAGGFIGDFINIANAIKQSETAKRNIGIGYMTSTDNDMYSAITHNAFINENTTSDTYYPLKKGIYSIAYRKLFDEPTIKKYRYYYTHWGFPIDDYVDTNYLPKLISYVNNSDNIGFVSFDRNWCLTNLTPLMNYNDNVVRNAIIDQMVEGIRIKRYS